MALANAVAGALRPSQAITWLRDDGAAEDLTGATITARLRNRATGAVRAAAGVFVVTDGPAGGYRWEYAAADVAEAGSFDVQFSAAFGAGPSPARTYTARWTVTESIG